jgi:transcriptional regulator with XRE-family HTH domain
MEASTGERLRAFAEVAYGSVAHLHRAMNVGETTLYKYLSNERGPGAKLLKRLEGAGCNTSWLLTGDGDMFADNPVGLDLYTRVTRDSSGATAAELGARSSHSSPNPIMTEIERLKQRLAGSDPAGMVELQKKIIELYEQLLSDKEREALLLQGQVQAYQQMVAVRSIAA